MADNIIKVNVTANKTQRVTVSSANVGTEITASSDTGKFWAQNAKNWAVSENIVDGEDYSSKYYANKSKSYAQNAENFEAASRETYDNIVTKSDNAITEIEELKEISEQEISIAVADGLTEINSKKNTAISDIEAVGEEEQEIFEILVDAEKQGIKDLVDAGKDEIQELTNEIKDSAEDIINRVGISMFDTILKDHLLTYEESKGLALQGTYVYKEAIAGSRYGYPDFYAKCLEEYNQATDTETVNGKTVKVHDNGHKFYDIANKTGIDEFFSTMGSAWFYGVDTENERIFLPRKNILNLTPETKINVYGDGNSVMLTGSISGGTATGRLLSHYAGGGLSHTFYLGNKNDLQSGTTGTLSYNVPAAGSTAYAGVGVATAEASDGKSVGLIADLENISTNQEYLYICVGNTVVDTSWVDVVTQVEGGVKDLEDKTNEGIEVLSNASNALRQTQITNCLLEVPQNIKLELNNGVLTLKAGSKVIVPNGVGVFEEITTASDIVFTDTAYDGVKFLLYDTSKNAVIQWGIADCFSGDTAPTSKKNMKWYDTTNGIIKHSGDYGVTWTGEFSFPLATVTVSDGNITIDQVFNGIGYIGSTIWVDKGVKGLIPNYRNADGTLNNIEFTTSKVLTATTQSGTRHIRLEANIIQTGELIYNETENINTVNGEYRGFAIVGTVTADSSNKITSFQPKLPFRAVDQNEFNNTPHVTETYVNGTSWYRIWSPDSTGKRWCEQGGQVTGVVYNSTTQNVTFLKTFKDTNYFTSATPIEGVHAVDGAWVSNKKTTGMVVKTGFQNGSTQLAANWQACGYIK